MSPPTCTLCSGCFHAYCILIVGWMHGGINEKGVIYFIGTYRHGAHRHFTALNRQVVRPQKSVTHGQCHAGPIRLGMSQFGQDRSSNPRDCECKSAPYWTRRQKSAYPIEYLVNYCTDLYQLFSIGRHVYEEYLVDISFAVA